MCLYGGEALLENIPEGTKFGVEYFLFERRPDVCEYQFYFKNILECILFWVRYHELFLHQCNPKNQSFWHYATAPVECRGDNGVMSEGFCKFGGDINVRSIADTMSASAKKATKHIQTFIKAQKNMDSEEWGKMCELFASGDCELAIQICKSFIK